MSDTADSEQRFTPSRPGLAASLVFLLTTASLTWPMALGRFLINPLNDQYSAGYSFRHFAAEWFRAHGGIPEWNPYIMGGMPYISAMHGDIFYPTAWLRWFLPTDTAMNLGFAVHFVLAGVFAYALLRAFRFSWTAAVTGGVAYQLTGILASLVNPGHDGKLFVSALAPLALLALVRAIRDRRREWYGVMALVVGLALISPHYQLTYYLLVACGLWTLWLVFLSPEKPGGAWWKPLTLALAAVLVGLALSAIQALPFWEYIPWSPRGAAVSSSQGWDYATNFSLPPVELFTTILPEFNGVIENYWGPNPLKFHSEYLGVVVLALAIFGWGNRERRPLLIGFAAIGGLFFLISLGRYTPFYLLWYEVMPMMKKVRAPGMAFYLVALPVAVMAAAGVEQLVARRTSSRLILGVFGTLAAFGALGALGLLQPLAESLAVPQRMAQVGANADELRAGALRLLVFALAGGAVCLAVAGGRLRGMVAAIAVVVVVAGDLWSLDRKFFRYSPPAEVTFADDDIIRYIKQQGGRSRVINLFGVYHGSILMAHEVQSLIGYHGNEVHYFDELMGGKNVWRHLLSQPHLWDLMAVRYIILPQVQDLPGYHRVLGPVPTASGSFGVLYEADSVPPYVRVLAAAAKAPDDQIVGAVVDPRFPYDRVALYPDTASVAVAEISQIPDPSPLHATLTEWQPGLIRIGLSGTAEVPQYLVVAETWYPDWRATVDGEPAQVLRGQGALLSVVLPPGAAEVEFSFHTSGYRAGMTISLMSLLGVLVWIAVPVALRRRDAGG